MSIEELEKVFKWLEKNINHQGIFYFRLTSHNQISTYLKRGDSLFAQFFASRILDFVKENENEQGDS